MSVRQLRAIARPWAPIALTACVSLMTTGVAGAARLHCVIPGGRQVAPKITAILGESDFVIDTDSLTSNDWAKWSIRGRPLALWLGPDSVAETRGGMVRISRSAKLERPRLLRAELGLDRQDLPAETGAALTIDLATGRAEIDQHVTLGADVTRWAWEGSCRAAP
ncbi:MAG TPA: hypothetical protein VE309_13955 [Caulobacteraceae bacterium]|nr:hypothetical protein [Caulobacteraceae bacterium]